MSSKADYIDTSKNCACGRPAVELNRSSKRCARCREIEQRNEAWLTNYHPNCSPKAVQLQSLHWWVETARMINKGYDAFAEKRGWPKATFNA